LQSFEFVDSIRIGQSNYFAIAVRKNDFKNLPIFVKNLGDKREEIDKTKMLFFVFDLDDFYKYLLSAEKVYIDMKTLYALDRFSVDTNLVKLLKPINIRNIF